MIGIKPNKSFKAFIGESIFLCSLLSAMSWLFILSGAGTGMDIWAMTNAHFPLPKSFYETKIWTINYSFKIFAMWWVMMIAMMLPGVALYLAKSALVSFELCIKFVGKYILVWMLFSIIVTAFQYSMEGFELLHTMKMWSVNDVFSLIVLVIVGLYQFSSIKQRSLKKCQITIYDNQNYSWQCLVANGPFMMALFVGGVMNLYWIVAITAVVSIEKQLPNPKYFSWAIGAVVLLLAVRVIV